MTKATNNIAEAAKSYAELGLIHLPIGDNKEPSDKFKGRSGAINKLRVKPLNEHNTDFYYDGAKGIALLTGGTLEVIDLDTKNDKTGKLENSFKSAYKNTLPDIYNKLPVQCTPSGGLHIFYRCHVIASNQVFAKRRATDQERKTGEREKVLIESRGEGGYIMVEPSAGYQLIHGSFEEIPFITPEEREVLHAMCRSFNQIIEPNLPGIGKQQRENPQAPWNVFNKKEGWQGILRMLTDAGYSIVDETEDRVLILRPGNPTSKASGTLWKESNCLFLFSTSTEFPANTPLSAFDVIKHMKYDGDTQACARGLSEQGIGIYNKEDGEFHEKSVSGKIKPKLRQIVDWMNDIGIRKHFLNSSDFQIVQVTENRVSIIDLNHIKKLFCDYVHRSSPQEIDEYFLSKFTKIFNKEGLINLIEPLQDDFIKPAEKEAWFYFNNVAAKVTASNIFSVEYGSLPGLIWEKNIIKREFSITAGQCEGEQFVSNVSGENKPAFEAAIGYCLHPFKDPANPKVTIFNDEYFDCDNDREPEGGTGKGMIIQMFSKFRNTVIKDGKTFRPDKSFLWQSVGPETELVAIEDARKNFDFEAVFSIATDGWTVEKKNMQEFTLPRERSPKIIITSNYPIKGSSQSHRRRRFELELKPHYSDRHTIQKEFGHLFFIDWDKDEWNRFDNYFLGCVQHYLANGLPAVITGNIEVSKLIAETNRDFVRWIEDLADTKLIPAKETKRVFIEKFKSMYPDYKTGKFEVNETRFGKWLKRWCDYVGISLDSSNKYNGEMCFHFRNLESWYSTRIGIFHPRKQAEKLVITRNGGSEWHGMNGTHPVLEEFEGF